MASAGGIDGRDFCTAVKNINGVVLAKIKGFLGNNKDCSTCTEIQLSQARDGGTACITACDTYYSDWDGSALVAGNIIYTNSDCTSTADRNFYSNKCSGRSGAYYSVGSDGDGVVGSTIVSCP
jgi:hypothetical protein